MRMSPDSSAAVEQIGGVIELNGTIHLVEMKWFKDPVGVGDFASHLVRVMSRAGASGIFISSSRYTEAVIEQCAGFLNHRANFLCTMKEIVSLLSRQADLADFMKAKSQAAIVGKQPLLEILS